MNKVCNGVNNVKKWHHPPSIPIIGSVLYAHIDMESLKKGLHRWNLQAHKDVFANKTGPVYMALSIFVSLLVDYPIIGHIGSPSTYSPVRAASAYTITAN